MSCAVIIEEINKLETGFSNKKIGNISGTPCHRLHNLLQTSLLPNAVAWHYVIYNLFYLNYLNYHFYHNLIQFLTIIETFEYYSNNLLGTTCEI